jgi:beta-lactamase superfamily II metal-dependent hydrolase
MPTRSLPLVTLALLAIGAAALAGPDDKALDFYWIDTEGGSAVLIVTPRGQSMLVDSGNAGDRDLGRILHVVRDVAKLEHIDYHQISHWHGDHFGSTPELAKKIPINSFIDHGPSVEGADFQQKFAWYLALDRGKSRRIWRPGDKLKLPGAGDGPAVEITCVCAHGQVLPNKDGSQPTKDGCDKHPAQPEDKSDNAQSIGYTLKFGDFDFFAGGDLTWNIEHRLVCPENKVGTVDVFQVNHHGLANSNNPALVHAIAPTVAVINSGPRKGAELAVLQTLRKSPGIEAIFQVHRNVRIADADNAPSEYIANHDEACQGDYVWLKVAPDGKSYTVSAGAAGKKVRFPTK